MKRKVWIPMTVIAAMLLIPVPLRYKDGGSVCFKAVLYDVTRFHQLDLDSQTGYDDGWRIRILGIPVYDDREEPDTKEADMAEHEAPPRGQPAAYDPILEEYSQMVQNDFYVDLRDSELYESSFGEHISMEIRTHEQDIYYALYDIDGNGTQELLIAGGEHGTVSPVFIPWNYDLYGWNGTHAVRIFPEMEFGYRTNFSLYENVVIEVFYSSSAAESGTDFYKIEDDGVSVRLIDSFMAMARLEGEIPVFTYMQNGTEISEEEYHARIQAYEISLSEAPEWIQIQ